MGKGQKLRQKGDEEQQQTATPPPTEATSSKRQLPLESQDLFESSDATSDTTIWDEEDVVPDSQLIEPTPPLRRKGAFEKKMPPDLDPEPEEEEDTQQSQDPGIRPQRGPARKKKRQFLAFPEHVELELAEWYRDHELLYNKKLKAYRDRDKKDAAYRKKADELNVAGEFLISDLYYVHVAITLHPKSSMGHSASPVNRTK